MPGPHRFRLGNLTKADPVEVGPDTGREAGAGAFPLDSPKGSPEGIPRRELRTGNSGGAVGIWFAADLDGHHAPGCVDSCCMRGSGAMCGLVDVNRGDNESAAVGFDPRRRFP